MRIKHRAVYRYAQPVQASLNEARLTPMATPWQIPLESTVRVPQAGWQYRYFDYWGTQVSSFEVRGAHSELTVEAVSLVEVDDARRPEVDAGIGWDVVRSDRIYQDMGEYLTATRFTEPVEQVATLAEQAAAVNLPHECARAICSRIHDAMTYQPGSTTVRTTAGQAWAARTGVCQDYAHLALSALRQVGIPARYVSGYLHPRREPTTGETHRGSSHAWVEWWVGRWSGYDPANDTPLSERHVIVGRGRDYADVPPIKGIVAGQAGHSKLAVTVEMTRLA